jgi:hypothetical protein
VKRITFPSTTGSVMVRGSALRTTSGVAGLLPGRGAPPRAIPDVVAHKNATRAPRMAELTRTGRGLIVSGWTSEIKMFVTSIRESRHSHSLS